MLQTDALEIMKMGHSVLLTGQAGSGKTYTLNRFISWALSHSLPVAVTASTGIAATHVNGQTIHRWSGIGIKDSLSDKDIESIAYRAPVLQRMNRAKILIIDEVSMLSAQMLDNVDRVMRYVLSDEHPFGGMQVILTGDLFQLPPVSRDGRAKLAVRADVWGKMNAVICYLSEQHRQDQDDPLTQILNALRAGEVSQEHRSALATRTSAAPGPEVTNLHSHNASVDQINTRKIDAIDEEPNIFHMTSHGRKDLVESLKKSCLAPETLILKPDAEVMFVKNDPAKSYANGTRGRVIKFDERGLPIIRTHSGKTITATQASWSISDESQKLLASIDQLPLRLAWAITIHKSQGMSLDEAQMDLSQVFEYGMGYVALSRARSLQGLYLTGMNESALLVNPEALQIDKQLRVHSKKAATRLGSLDSQQIKNKIDQSITNKGGQLAAKSPGEVSAANANGTQDSHQETVKLLTENDKLSIKDVALKRGLTQQTIVSHIARALDESSDKRALAGDLERFKPSAKLVKSTHKFLAKNPGKIGLKDLREQISTSKSKPSYNDLKLAVSWPLDK